VGPRAVWTGVENLALPHSGFHSQTFRPIESSYTYCVTPKD